MTLKVYVCVGQSRAEQNCIVRLELELELYLYIRLADCMPACLRDFRFNLS